MKRLQTFDSRCLRNIANMRWWQGVRTQDVLRRVFGSTGKFDTLEKEINLCRCRWLGHVLWMPSHRLPYKLLFAIPNPEWRKASGGQRMTWKKEVKSYTRRLGVIGRSRLSGWGTRDASNTWMETLREIVVNRA